MSPEFFIWQYYRITSKKVAKKTNSAKKAFTFCKRGILRPIQEQLSIASLELFTSQEYPLKTIEDRQPTHRER